MAMMFETETEEKAWQDYANCLGVDPDLFFPERGSIDARGQGGVPGLRRARRMPGVRPAKRRKVRDLGWDERARTGARIRRQRALARAAAAAQQATVTA